MRAPTPHQIPPVPTLSPATLIVQHEFSAPIISYALPSDLYCLRCSTFLTAWSFTQLCLLRALPYLSCYPLARFPPMTPQAILNVSLGSLHSFHSQLLKSLSHLSLPTSHSRFSCAIYLRTCRRSSIPLSLTLLVFPTDPQWPIKNLKLHSTPAPLTVARH